MATEKAAHSIPVENFRSEQDSFDDWIKLFEDAVSLATNAPDDRKELLYKKWLPLKLDNRSRELLKNCTLAATWTILKKELKGFLVDPQEKYNWQTNRATQAWDGKESFHVLANKTKRLVDLYSENEEKKNEYFFRFRQALPTDYRRAIDLGCDETKRTIDEAKKMAFRFQMSQLDSDLPANTGRLATATNVSFTGAAMSDDRLKSVEMALQGVNVQLETMGSRIEKQGKSGDRPEGRDSPLPSSRESSYGRSQDRYRGRDRYDSSGDRHSSRGWDRDRDSNSRDRGSHNDRGYSRDRGSRNDRGYSRDRGSYNDRDNSRDRRGHVNRDDSRDQRSRYSSDDNRGRRDDHDRNNSRNDRGNRDYDPREGGRSRQGSRDSDRDSRDRRDNRPGKSGPGSHRLAALDFEPMFEKLCSLVVENSKQDKSEN